MAEDARVPALRASEGRLTFEELADRVEAAARAVTRTDLEALTDDLPAEFPAPPQPRDARAPTRASTVFAHVRRTGAWTVPAMGKWESLFGDVALDVRGARVTAPEKHINAGTIFGDVELLVPEGVEVRSGRGCSSATSSRWPGRPHRRERHGSFSPVGRFSATYWFALARARAWPTGFARGAAPPSTRRASLLARPHSSRS
jgi:Domain of unknown function (DUF1707)